MYIVFFLNMSKKELDQMKVFFIEQRSRLYVCVCACRYLFVVDAK